MIRHSERIKMETKIDGQDIIESDEEMDKIGRAHV